MRHTAAQKTRRGASVGYKRIAGHGMIAGYRRIAGFLAVCALITGMPFDAQGRVAAAPAITGETTPLAEASASPGETPPDPAPPEETLPPEPAPLGEIMPLDPELFYGDTVTFELVNVETGGELTCQWYKDGELLDDETLPKLTIDCVSLSDAGVYSCEAVLESPDEAVKLVCESVLSVSKAEPLICVSASPESGSLYSGEGITLTAVVSHPVNGEAEDRKSVV